MRQQTEAPVAETLDMAALTPNQQAVLGNIALGADGFHHPATLRALEQKGLIVPYRETLLGALPVYITRYTVPLHLHIQWCEWCSEQLQEEEDE